MLKKYFAFFRMQENAASYYHLLTPFPDRKKLEDRNKILDDKT